MDHNNPSEKMQYLAGYDAAVGIVIAAILHRLPDDAGRDILGKLHAVPRFENEEMWQGFLDARSQMGQPPRK